MIDYVRRFYGYKNPNMQQLKENYEDKVAPFSAPGFYNLGRGKYGESLSVFVGGAGQKYFIDKVLVDEGIRVMAKTFVSTQNLEGAFSEVVMHEYSAPTINEVKYSGQSLSLDGQFKELSAEESKNFFDEACKQFDNIKTPQFAASPE